MINFYMNMQIRRLRGCTHRIRRDIIKEAEERALKKRPYLTGQRFGKLTVLRAAAATKAAAVPAGRTKDRIR